MIKMEQGKKKYLKFLNIALTLMVLHFFSFNKIKEDNSNKQLHII